MKAKLVEVDFIFLTGETDGSHGNRVTVQAGLLRKKLYLSFCIGGPADNRECLPAALIDAIRAGLEYARKHVRVADLVEQDLEPEEIEDRN